MANRKPHLNINTCNQSRRPKPNKKIKKTAEKKQKNGRASEKFSAFSGHVMKVQAFSIPFSWKSGSWSLARERKSAGGFHSRFPGFPHPQ